MEWTDKISSTAITTSASCGLSINELIITAYDNPTTEDKERVIRELAKLSLQDKKALTRVVIDNIISRISLGSRMDINYETLLHTPLELQLLQYGMGIHPDLLGTIELGKGVTVFPPVRSR